MNNTTVSLFIAAIFAALLFSSHASAQPAERLVYRSPQGVEYDANSDGLSAIRAGGRELAHGGWSFKSGEPWFMNEPGPFDKGSCVSRRAAGKFVFILSMLAVVELLSF